MAEVRKELTTLDDKTLMLFEGNLKRIFAMKITRSTFREIQNVIINCCNGDKRLANELFETLMTGQVKEGLGNDKQKPILENIIKDFTIPTRLAKEVLERGEFVNIITSDTLQQNDQIAFLNRVRRIDGDEFIFLTDPESTIHLLKHFIGRFNELEKNPQGKEFIQKHRKELSALGEKLRTMNP